MYVCFSVCFYANMLVSSLWMRKQSKSLTNALLISLHEEKLSRERQYNFKTITCSFSIFHFAFFFTKHNKGVNKLWYRWSCVSAAQIVGDTENETAHVQTSQEEGECNGAWQCMVD